jgi:hypothetical protein
MRKRKNKPEEARGKKRVKEQEEE